MDSVKIKNATHKIMMAKQKLDIDDIRTIQELIGGKSTQTVVPTMQVPTQDSFSSFTGGITKGWPFILAMVSIAFWITQSIYGINSTLLQHDNRITQNTEAVKQIDGKLDQASQSNSDIIRRLDSLQTAVDTLKNSK